MQDQTQNNGTDFCKKLRELRKGMKLTQESLGKEIGVSNQVICAWEKGNAVPDKAQAAKLDAFFKTTFDVPEHVQKPAKAKKADTPKPKADGAKSAKSGEAKKTASKPAAAQAPKGSLPAQARAAKAKEAPAKDHKQHAEAKAPHADHARPAHHAPADRGHAHVASHHERPSIAIYALAADSAHKDAASADKAHREIIVKLLESALAEFKKH